MIVLKPDHGNVPQSSPFNLVSDFLKAAGLGGALGTAHYWVMRGAVYFGSNIPLSALKIHAYLLMHFIKSGVEYTGKLAWWTGMHVLGDREKCQSGDKEVRCLLLRKGAWKVIGAVEKVPKKVDSLYSTVFRIRTAEQIKKEEIRDKDLYLSEIVRKLLMEHLAEQFLDIAGWELGKRGAELLLKCTIPVLLPGTFEIYALQVIGSFIFKCYSFRAQLFAQQKAQLPVIKSKIDLLKKLMLVTDAFIDGPHKGELGPKKYEKRLEILFKQLYPREAVPNGPLTASQRVVLMMNMVENLHVQLSKFEDYWIRCEGDDMDELQKDYKALEKGVDQLLKKLWKTLEANPVKVENPSEPPINKELNYIKAFYRQLKEENRRLNDELLKIDSKTKPIEIQVDSDKWEVSKKNSSEQNELCKKHAKAKAKYAERVACFNEIVNAKSARKWPEKNEELRGQFKESVELLRKVREYVYVQPSPVLKEKIDKDLTHLNSKLGEVGLWMKSNNPYYRLTEAILKKCTLLIEAVDVEESLLQQEIFAEEKA